MITTTTAAAALYFGLVDTAIAQNLTPSNVFMSAYNAPQIGGVAVPATRANAFTAITDGIMGGGNGLDTFNLDGFGIVKDFVGLEYSTPQRFDTLTVNLGNQFPDGGDWEAKPKIYILKNRTLTGDLVEPNLSPNWVEVTGAVETTGHVFSNSAPGPGGMVRFDLSAIPAAQRSGWGWAVGGVDGSANGSGVWNFISVTEASATGAATGVAPAYTPPSTPVPTNVVTNLVHSLGRGAAGLGASGLIDGNRGQAFASVTNGLLDRNIGLGDDGFDTLGGDPAGTLTDFVGLQYGSAYKFDSIKVELGRQFSNGGDWQATPKIYILKNPVDTASSRPETDPTNWLEVTGAVETTGHAFNPIALNGAGGTINFNLSSIPVNQRTGWGWAIGGVDGNQNAGGGDNFISITEASATGTLVPGPFEIKLEVNTSTGAARLLNSTPFNMSLDFYRITSENGSLNVAGWNSLESPAGNPGGFPAGNGSGNGWEGLGNPSDEEVAEAFLQNSSTLAPGASATLGNLFSIGETPDLDFRYRAPDGVFYDATVQYVSGGFLPADFNQSGTVDSTDLTIWRSAYKTTGAGDADADGDSDGRDFLIWQRQFGLSGSLSSAMAVPEPTLFAMLSGVAASALLIRRRSATATSCCRFAVLFVVITSLTVSSSMANVTDDRLYRLGDDSLEHGSAGIVLGAGVGNVAPGSTLDSQGPGGNNAYIDIQVFGTPRYTSVSDRPGAGATLGALFDGPGSGDYLRTLVSMNVPSSMWDNTTFFPPATPFGLNYEGILSHGIQLWAKPNLVTQGVRQDLILDTAQHGIFITATNNWGLQYGDAFNNNQIVNIDSGVPVAFNAWNHVMQLGGYGDPDEGRSNQGRVLLVNGVAVAASNTFYGGDSTALSIGASQNGAANFYNGVLDDVRLFFWGDNSGQTNGGAGPNGKDWGNLDLAQDNQWIANRLATLGVTDIADVNLNGTVDNNDVTAFLPDWLKVRRVNGVQVGDWTSRQDGDLNYDGIVDLEDAYLLHQGLLDAGFTGGLNFSLLGTAVPEPTGAVLAAAGLVWGACRRSRRQAVR